MANPPRSIDDYYLGIRPRESVPNDLPFNGTIDEIAIYNRALSLAEIRAHANRYHPNATLRSVPITLPTNQTWSTFHCNRTVPENTRLNISIHDAATNETLFINTNRTDDLYLDLSVIDPVEHPSIYLDAHLQSNRTETPILYDWAVNWTPMIHPPQLIHEVPQELQIIEDTPEDGIIDLADVFHDRYSSIAPPAYGIEFVSDPANITLALNGSRLDVTELAANWSGTCSVRLNCTNVYGLTAATPMFNISAQPVDDAPAWVAIPPLITVTQGSSVTSGYSLDDYVVDAENDPWEFTAASDDVLASVNEANNLTIDAGDTFSGDTEVIVKVSQSTNASLYSNVTIPVKVLAGTPFEIRLLSPRNGTTMVENDVTLKWMILEAGNLSNPVSFDLYFGENRTPPLYDSGINGTNFTLTGLKDRTTYYWYVLPSDTYGICLNGTWSFTVNSSMVLPEVIYMSPLDGQIVNTTDVLLAWKTLNWSGNVLNYDIYLGDSELNLTLNATTKEESYLLRGLSDGDYYWKIVSWNDTVTGISGSGIRSFTVNTSYEIVYAIDVTAEVAELVFMRGRNQMFTINVSNIGNMETYITITVVGSLKDYVEIPANITLQPGGSLKFVVTISGTSSLKLGSYELIIEFVFFGRKETITIPVKITTDINPPEPHGETGGDEGLSGTAVGLIIAGVVLVLIVVIVVFIVLRKKKREKHEPGVSEEEMQATTSPEAIPGETPLIPPTSEAPGNHFQSVSPEGATQPVLSAPEVPPPVYETAAEEMPPPADEVEPVPGEPEGSPVSTVPPIPESAGMPLEPPAVMEPPEGFGNLQPPMEPTAPGTEVPLPPPVQEIVGTTYRDHLSKTLPEEAKKTMAGLIPNYNITHKLGAGGFGTVYKAAHIGGRNVALKLPKILDETVDMSVLHKFREEAEIWRKLSHNNIVEFIESDIQPVPYLAIELMEGGNLKQLVTRYQLSVGEAVYIMAQILDGMSYAHRMATIHRDLKPENILFTSEGIPKITDWGIGKFMGSMSTEKTMGMKGTMLYSAPEQISKAKFGQVDWTTDIFQLGIVFYEMITRQHPFYDEDPVGIIGKITGEDPVPPSAVNSKVPKELDSIIMTALEKDKGKRWRSADVMYHELRRLLEG